jgi:hypothetical protein
MSRWYSLIYYANSSFNIHLLKVSIFISHTMLDKEILLGTLLGDSSLQTYTKGKTWRLRFIQKDKDYIFHLYEIWKPFVGTSPKLLDDGSGNFRWYFNTKVIPELSEFVKETQINTLIGQNFVKKVPKDLPDLNKYLTERALAYWYMDNGSKKSNVEAYYFCTDSFTLEDIHFLGNIFYTKWGIKVGYHKHGSYYRIYIPVSSGVKLKNLIEKYVIDSLKYKL